MYGKGNILDHLVVYETDSTTYSELIKNITHLLRQKQRRSGDYLCMFKFTYWYLCHRTLL